MKYNFINAICLIIFLFFNFHAIGQKDTLYYDNENIKAIGKTEKNLNSKFGEWIFYYETGSIKTKVNYSNSVRDGKFVEYYPNQKVKIKMKYFSGTPIGKMISYYPNGVIKEKGRFKLNKKQIFSCPENLVMSVKVGIWKKYHENGRPMEIGKYSPLIKCDVIITKEIDPDNGLETYKEETKVTYLKNKKWLFFNEAGILVKTQIFKKGDLIDEEYYE